MRWLGDNTGDWSRARGLVLLAAAPFYLVLFGLFFAAYAVEEIRR